MKKLVAFFLIITSCIAVGCNDSHDCGPDWEPPYIGPTGEPGAPSNDDDTYGHRVLSPDDERQQWQQLSDEDKELIRHQCGC